MRNEHDANQALAARPAPATWTKPSTCKRASRPCFLRRLFNLFA